MAAWRGMAISLSVGVVLGTCPAWSRAADANCSATSPERFIDFLPTFTDTKRFAVARTELPLPLLHWAPGQSHQDTPERSELPSAEYRRWPTIAKFMNDSELLSRVAEQTATSAAIELFKDDSPGLVTFRFRLKAGCWYLWQYEVHES
jgi:hypothetical protein